MIDDYIEFLINGNRHEVDLILYEILSNISKPRHLVQLQV